MAARLWILILPIRIFVEVDTLEIVEVKVVDVGVGVPRDLSMSFFLQALFFVVDQLHVFVVSTTKI